MCLASFFHVGERGDRCEIDCQSLEFSKSLHQKIGGGSRKSWIVLNVGFRVRAVLSESRSHEQNIAIASTRAPTSQMFRQDQLVGGNLDVDRKSTRLNSSHLG